MHKADWIWMPHAGHFICADRCQFRLNTYVGEFIVSTAGEFMLNPDNTEFTDIGLNRKYETMVFAAKHISERTCCPYRITGDELDVKGYNTPQDAYAGHMAICKTWAAKAQAKELKRAKQWLNGNQDM
jgi:hypothetical protein